MSQRMWAVWNPKQNATTIRGPQATRPREHATAVVVDSWPVGDQPPASSSAQEWDAWRLRRGVAGER